MIGPAKISIVQVLGAVRHPLQVLRAAKCRKDPDSLTRTVGDISPKCNPVFRKSRAGLESGRRDRNLIHVLWFPSTVCLAPVEVQTVKWIEPLADRTEGAN